MEEPQGVITGVAAEPLSGDEDGVLQGVHEAVT
jgi:hypothetical protein